MNPRLELRPDAYRVATDSGMYILGNQGPVRLAGAAIAQWVDRLAPVLDGQHELEELIAGLSAERQEMVGRIVVALRSHGVIRERHRPPDSGEPSADPPEISFLDYFRDDAAAAFQRYRATRAVVVGGGALVPAVAAAARRSGLESVLVVPTGAGADLGEALAGAALVLQIDDGWSGREARSLEEHCAHAGPLLAQVAVRGGRAWLLPAGGHDGPRWSAAQPRLPGPTATADPTPAAASVVAAQLVQDAFLVLTGVADSRATNEVTAVDVNTLCSSRHAFLPHPFAAPAVADSQPEFRTRLALLGQGLRHPEEMFARQVSRCGDAHLGIISLHEHDWAQRPLSVVQARVPDPVGLCEGAGPLTAVRTGWGRQEARAAAARRGLALYGQLLVDPRRLVDGSGQPLVHPDADPYESLAALRAGEVTGWVWGYEVAEPDRVRLVPAATAFPYLLSPGPSDPLELAGLGAGLDWESAVRAGLLDHCHRRTVRELGTGTTVPPVPLSTVTLDEAGERCRDLLAAVDETPTVYDITGSLEVPAYAFCQGSRTVAYATGGTGRAAVRRGLSQVLREVQARYHRQPALAQAPVADLPAPQRGTTPGARVPREVAPQPAAVADRLRAAGRVAVAIPLDHDPGVTAVLPYLVKVVLLDA